MGQEKRLDGWVEQSSQRETEVQRDEGRSRGREREQHEVPEEMSVLPLPFSDLEFFPPIANLLIELDPGAGGAPEMSKRK